MKQRQPALFLSHGSPMLAIENSVTSKFLERLGSSLSKPDAIVMFSAHFDLANDIVITAGQYPQTIHDFGGFPDELYDIHYPAPGSPGLAREITILFQHAGLDPKIDEQRGWDHGVWIPMRLMYPQADIPIVQVSINSRLGATQNYSYGKLVASLRDKNIMIVGSGGMSHNLQQVFSRQPITNRSNMVQEFLDWVHEKLVTKDTDALLDYMEQAPHVMFNHPTQEHFLPLFTALGSSDLSKVERLHHDIEYDVLAMDAYRFD